MKNIMLIIFLLHAYVRNSQILFQPELNDPNYDDIKKRNDSISKIIIEPDTITKYKIKEIIEKDEFYIIYAEGIAKDKNLYQYRIKSKKYDCSKNNQLKVGESYQLDIRDFDNHNMRHHFRVGFPINLINRTNFTPFDLVSYLEDPLAKNEYNTVLNLKGLCIIPHPLLE